MKNKIAIFFIVFGIVLTSTLPTTISLTNAGKVYGGEEYITYRNVTVYAPAVASTESGYIGVISTITVTIQSNGSGRVFVDTLPLTQVDMQGSARLAVKVASAIVKNEKNSTVDPSEYDYFFVVRTSAPIIGGPSAGGIMTVAAVSLLNNWTINNETVMTGMINPDGSIGPIGGIPQKIDAAYSVSANRFLFPKGQGTYTEMVTTTETRNGWIRTVTTPVTRNVADYAWDNYAIEAIEVGDIYEAVEYFTGNTFIFEGGGQEITTEQYNQSIQPLASQLLDDAKYYYENASQMLNESSIPNVPSGFGFNFRDYVTQDLQRAEQRLDESTSWYEENVYYTSMSKSFQSTISSRLVTYACEYYEAGNLSYEYLEDLLSDAQDFCENASNLAETSEINGYISLQSVGAAQRRASEANQYLDAAVDEIESITTYNDVLSFLEKIAFVIERSSSVSWWIDIGTKFDDSGNLTNATVENLALEYIEEASQSSVYSSVILSEMGSSYTDSADYLADAETLIDNARDDLDKNYPAAALFEALEALVYANLAIEIIGTNSEEKINLSSETASNNIAKSRAHGIEPVLAVSYYEFAESLKEEGNNDAALIYYKYGGMIAGALGFTNISTGTSSSIYGGIPEFKTLFWFENLNTIFMVAMFILGGIAGLGVGLIISGLSKKEGKNPPKKESPGYTQDVKVTYKVRYRYPNEETPRSIREFYKKHK